MAKIVPVILCGGSGTRLWPISRSMYPKQLVRGLFEEGVSLLGETLVRLPADSEISAPVVISNNSHRFLVKEECDNYGIQPRAIILEPVGRNTAPAIAVSALSVLADDPDATLVVMPSDHVVKDRAQFRREIERAATVAAEGKIVLFGIKPTEPHSGYGYIQSGAPLSGALGYAHSVARFVEKPDVETARDYLKAGNYFWNSGIFVFRADAFLSELARLEPRILEAAREALENAKPDLGFLRLDAEHFSNAPAISVDYAVMEKTKLAAVLPLDIGWSDLGSWSALWDVSPHDANGNVVLGDAILEDTHDSYIRSNRALVSAIGVRDLVVVETPDSILVAHKSRAQDVSRVVDRLKRANRTEHEQHVRNMRPWGFFQTLNLGPRFQVKLLHVKPGGILSMQMHHHRSEHWIVVQGTAKVTVEGVEKLVRENESVYIIATQWHRLENPGKVPLELIEVQIGTYLGEDDIIRGEDAYARAPDETR